MEPAPEPQLDSKQRRAFALAKRAARQVVQRRTRVLRLARDSYLKLAKNEKALTKVRDDLRALGRLARAWAMREYRSVPWRTVLYTVAALVYFVNPVDLIPDALAGLGLVDDVAIVAAVVKAIQDDLDAFRQWDETRQLSP